MGIALILLGLFAAGIVVDFLVENGSMAADDRTYAFFGGSFSLSQPELVIGAAMLGTLSVVLVLLGVGLARGSRGRRRALKHRVADLESENARLRSRVTVVAATPPSPSRPDESAAFGRKEEDQVSAADRA